MIDIHTHLLPSIDDGAKDTKESVEMLSSSFKKGVGACVATPHCRIHGDDDISTFLEARKNSYETLSAALAESAEPLPEIFLGSEVFVDNDISRYEGIERLCIGDTMHMLLEFPSFLGRGKTAECIHELSVKGITPIIAHVNRYPFDSYLIDELREFDVIYQIDCDLFLSMRGRKYVKNLIKKGYVPVAASDMHNMSTRISKLDLAYAMAKKNFPEYADDMFFGIARGILYGRTAEEKIASLKKQDGR